MVNVAFIWQLSSRLVHRAVSQEVGARQCLPGRLTRPRGREGVVGGVPEGDWGRGLLPRTRKMLTPEMCSQ